MNYIYSFIIFEAGAFSGFFVAALLICSLQTTGAIL